MDNYEGSGIKRLFNGDEADVNGAPLPEELRCKLFEDIEPMRVVRPGLFDMFSKPVDMEHTSDAFYNLWGEHSPVVGKSVTINLSANNLKPPTFEKGQKILKGSNMLNAVTVKNKRTIYRMLRKKYEPYFKVLEVYNGNESTTLTLKSVVR
jgi:hypothetical protein